MDLRFIFVLNAMCLMCLMCGVIETGNTREGAGHSCFCVVFTTAAGSGHCCRVCVIETVGAVMAYASSLRIKWLPATSLLCKSRWLLWLPPPWFSVLPLPFYEVVWILNCEKSFLDWRAPTLSHKQVWLLGIIILHTEWHSFDLIRVLYLKYCLPCVRCWCVLCYVGLQASGMVVNRWN